jgi:hypothetical protein
MTSVFLAWFSAGAALIIMIGGLAAWLDSRATLKAALTNFTEGLAEVRRDLKETVSVLVRHESRLVKIETVCGARHSERRLEAWETERQISASEERQS